MWQALSEFTTAFLDPISIWIGVLLAIPVVWTWFDVVVGSRRRRRRWFRAIRRQPGERPGMLVLDMLPGKNIQADVENFRLQQEALKDIPPERIITIVRDNPLRPTHMSALVDEIRSAANRLMAQGVDTLHFFHAGPAVAAALVGAEFANGCRVMLYQHKPGGYENFGPLRHDW